MHKALGGGPRVRLKNVVLPVLYMRNLIVEIKGPLHNGNSYSGKTASLYWIWPQRLSWDRLCTGWSQPGVSVSFYWESLSWTPRRHLQVAPDAQPPGGGGGYSSSSRAGRLGRTLWPQNSTSVAETEKGGQNSTMTPPTLEKGGQYSTSVWKVCKKGGQKSTILKNIGVKILQVWKWGSKFYMLKNRGQNSTMLEKRGSIFYIRPQK